jgi:hypothetical protein
VRDCAVCCSSDASLPESEMFLFRKACRVPDTPEPSGSSLFPVLVRRADSRFDSESPMDLDTVASKQVGTTTTTTMVLGCIEIRFLEKNPLDRMPSMYGRLVSLYDEISFQRK